MSLEFKPFISACPPGTYKSRAVPGDVRSCTRCPDENHTTFKGSTDVSQCVCKKGYRDFNNTGCVGKAELNFIASCQKGWTSVRGVLQSIKRTELLFIKSLEY